MKNRFKSILILASLTTMTSVFAVAPLPSGWYLEANGGNSRLSNVDTGPGVSLSNSGLGLNLNAGYKFIPFFAAEIGYGKYADSTLKFLGTKVGDVSYYSYDAAAKALLPIGDTGAELFAKLGVAHINAKIEGSNNNLGVLVDNDSSSSNGYYFGLGADYSFMPAMAVNVQWQRAKGNDDTGNLDLYSLGISYLFG